jgi:GntR family transcriptional regulator, transcriptional repressor for pyruvate dehydrogenase complex
MTARNMAFRPLVPPKNLTVKLVDLLAAEITSGKLAPGARLPTEQEMMASFGVSRTVIREAVSALRSEGLVLTRQGVGAFVAADVKGRPFRIDPDGLKSLHEILRIMELRMSVEIFAAGLAAERRSVGQLQRIAVALGKIDAAIARGETAISADFDFHRAIAKATGNPYFQNFLDYLGHYIIPRQTLRIEQRDSGTQAAYLRKVQGEHHAIHDAIAGGDAPAARAAMRAHLESSIERYSRFEAELSSLTRAKSKAPRKPTAR